MSKARSLVVKGFMVSYDGRAVVEIVKTKVPGDQFDRELNSANAIRSSFRHSSPGSDWGCDGVGYAVQLRMQEVHIHRSGVGPKKFNEGVEALKQKGYDVQEA